jgi:hypothetical protein
VASLEEPEIKGWERAKITLLRILNLTVQLKKSKSTEIITNYVSKFRIIEDFIAKSSCSIKHSVIVSEFHDFLKTAPTRGASHLCEWRGLRPRHSHKWGESAHFAGALRPQNERFK